MMGNCDMSIADPSTRWLNDTMEQTISVGKLSYPAVIGILVKKFFYSIFLTPPLNVYKSYKKFFKANFS